MKLEAHPQPNTNYWHYKSEGLKKKTVDDGYSIDPINLCHFSHHLNLCLPTIFKTEK